MPVDGPLTDDDLAAIKSLNRPVLFLVLAGFETPKGVSAPGLIRATLAAAEPVRRHHPLSRAARVPTQCAKRRHASAAVVYAYAPGPDVWWPTGRGAVGSAIAPVLESDRPTGLRPGRCDLLHRAVRERQGDACPSAVQSAHRDRRPHGHAARR